MRRVLSSLLFVALVWGAACGDESPGPTWSAPVVHRRSGTVTVRVWVCRVPVDSTAVEYGGLPLRYDVDAPTVVAALAGVDQYFTDVSHGALRLRLVVGGDVSLAVTDGPQQCVSTARDSTPADELVLAVADAEHAADQPGGFGITAGPGVPGAAYVGGNDLAALPGPPPLDLVEHELGHAIGWVHSAYDASNGVDGRYRSGLDVMSDSEAARRADPSRRHGPDTLAINRLLVGWLPIDEVAVLGSARTTVALSPSTRPAATGAHRLAVLPTGDGRFVTVESLVAERYHGYLPGSGVAVHEVTVVDGVVTDVQPLHSSSPSTELLGPGESLVVSGRVLRVVGSTGGVMTVTVDEG